MKIFYNIRKFIRHTLESFKQVIFWFPVIWKTRDFDYGYLLEIMELKMKRMLDFLTSKKCMSIMEEADLLALKRCINIIDVIDNETYRDAKFEEHYKKYPMKPFEEMFINDPKHTDEDESKSFRLANESSEKLHGELMNEFSRLFITHYRTWWD